MIDKKSEDLPCYITDDNMPPDYSEFVDEDIYKMYSKSCVPTFEILLAQLIKELRLSRVKMCVKCEDVYRSYGVCQNCSTGEDSD